jgi:hypothetical protein
MKQPNHGSYPSDRNEPQAHNNDSNPVVQYFSENISSLVLYWAFFVAQLAVWSFAFQAASQTTAIGNVAVWSAFAIGLIGGAFAATGTLVVAMYRYYNNSVGSIAFLG